MTLIADMVAKMIEMGCSKEVIKLAVETAEQIGLSTRIPPENRVENVTENRRRWDREYRRRRKDSTRIPPDSTRIPPDIKNPLLSVLEEKEERKDKKKTKERGTRIPPDWLPVGSDRQFAIDLGATEAEIDSEGGGFVDFWTAKPGKDGYKLDWSATWRNRMRN